MFHAPAAQARFAGRGAWRALQVALAAASAGCAALWLAGRPGLPAAVAPLAVVAAAVAAAALALRSTSAPAGRLCWDGAAWSVAIDGREPWPGTPAPAIDLGPWMLVRFSTAPCADRDRPRTLWLALAQSAAPGDWGPLRAALFAGTRRGDGGAAVS